MARWRCLEPDCGAEGEAVNKSIARVRLAAHYADAHNQVPWMDGDE